MSRRRWERIRHALATHNAGRAKQGEQGETDVEREVGTSLLPRGGCIHVNTMTRALWPDSRTRVLSAAFPYESKYVEILGSKMLWFPKTRIR